MKTSNLLVFVLILTVACTKKVSTSKERVQNVVVILYDISKSMDTYSFLDTVHLGRIFSAISKNGGGKFYCLHIKSNSEKQDPIEAKIPSLDLLPMQGNAFQQSNRRKRNEQLEEEFKIGKGLFIQAVSEKLICPKTEPYSDVKNALEISKTILENKDYSNYSKYLLIISDMENDFPPKNGSDEMEGILLDRSINVYLVRPSSRVNLEELLPTTNYSSFITIEDAINSIFNN